MLNRVNRVLVTNVEAANTGTTLNSIINGDILVLDNALANITSGTVTSAQDRDQIYIAQGISAGKAVLSSPIQVRNVRSVRRLAYSAPAEQVTQIGYNGVSGALSAVANSTDYTLIIVAKDDQRVQENRQTREVYSSLSDSTATIPEVTTAFVRRINRRSQIVTAVLLSNNAGAALTGTGTITANNGSKIVTAGTSATAVLSVGDYLRIGSTATTGGVYKITALSGTTITLDTPYQGATITAQAEASSNFVSAALFLAGSIGIQLTAKTIVANAIDLYAKYSFEVSLSSSLTDAETVTYSTAATKGHGYWQEVKDLEYFASGYLGMTNRTKFPANTLPATRAVENNTYNLLVIEHNDIHEGSMQSQMASPLTTVIAFYSSSAPTKSTKETAVIAILETIFEGSPTGIFVQ